MCFVVESLVASDVGRLVPTWMRMPNTLLPALCARFLLFRQCQLKKRLLLLFEDAADFCDCASR